MYSVFSIILRQKKVKQVLFLKDVYLIKEIKPLVKTSTFMFMRILKVLPMKFQQMYIHIVTKTKLTRFKLNDKDNRKPFENN